MRNPLRDRATDVTREVNVSRAVPKPPRLSRASRRFARLPAGGPTGVACAIAAVACAIGLVVVQPRLLPSPIRDSNHAEGPPVQPPRTVSSKPKPSVGGLTGDASHQGDASRHGEARAASPSVKPRPTPVPEPQADEPEPEEGPTSPPAQPPSQRPDDDSRDHDDESRDHDSRDLEGEAEEVHDGDNEDAGDCGGAHDCLGDP